MSETQDTTPRYFWKSFELTAKQARAVQTLGSDDVFVETETHKRDDEFIREAWK